MAINTVATPEAFVETIPLPAIPLQKWIMISVIKDGRQINVYYNNLLVSSSKMLNMISNVNISGTVAVAGNVGLTGTIALVRMISTKMSIHDVNAYYSSSIDTRGSPTALSVTTTESGIKATATQSSSLSKALCLDLSCISLPAINSAADQFLKSPETISPIAHLYTFNSQYD